MAYGVKFELFFQDVEERRFKVEILKKGYSGTVYPLTGTGKPVEIIWTGDDDIYSPIIGSRCKLNLLCTNDSNYDDFYKGDEREYLVKVLKFDSVGYFWEAEPSVWDLYDSEWDEQTGGQKFYQSIWEGYLVVDRFKEQMVHKPFEMNLEAVDGLGTLEGFDAPFDSDDTDVKENLFYYLKEILLLTGHNHQMFISNDTRKTDGATNDTIFHDIEVNKYALFTKNLTFRTAKDILEQILKITNSRIYHSLARWYIVNNSTLIDTRIDQLAEAPSGEDTSIEPAPTPAPEDVIEQPVIDILANGQSTSTVTVYAGAHIIFTILNSGSPLDSWTWTYPSGTRSGTGTPSLSFIAQTSHNGQTVSISGTNESGSDSDSVTLNVLTASPPPPDEPEDQGGIIKINVANGIENTTVTPNPAILEFEDYEVGDNYTFDFELRSNGGFELTSQDQYSLTILGASATKVSLTNGVAKFTVTGNIVSGGFTKTLTLSGNVPHKKFTTTVNFSESVTNASIDDSTTFTFTEQENRAFSETRRITPDANYFFNNLGKVSAVFTDGTNVSRSMTLNEDGTSIDITISGQISDQDITDTLTITGNAITSNDATGLQSGVTISTAETIAGYATYLFTGQYISKPANSGIFDGRFVIDAVSIDGTATPVNWVFPSPVEGDEETTQITLRFAGNYSYGGVRYAFVRFKSKSSGAILHTLTITQPSLVS